jgi:hypothetical protein
MRRYEMSDDDLSIFLRIQEIVPLMAYSGLRPMFMSQQEMYDKAWRNLGKKMGFKWDTVESTGEGNRFFTAIPCERSE